MIDPNSETWLSLKKEIKDRIAKLHVDLEIVGVDPDPVRGEIAGLRWVLKTAEPDAPITEPTGTDYMQTSAPDPS